ncbi:hypothetical protein K438DRAFT_1760985 [Mycena galopus ATCC 62051]|nr:hypothetical protein K438DRAFT_1760985 [Mycena galopus ATCC 62051]
MLCRFREAQAAELGWARGATGGRLLELRAAERDFAESREDIGCTLTPHFIFLSKIHLRYFGHAKDLPGVRPLTVRQERRVGATPCSSVSPVPESQAGELWRERGGVGVGGKGGGGGCVAEFWADAEENLNRDIPVKANSKSKRRSRRTRRVPRRSQSQGKSRYGEGGGEEEDEEEEDEENENEEAGSSND